MHAGYVVVDQAQSPAPNSCHNTAAEAQGKKAQATCRPISSAGAGTLKQFFALKRRLRQSAKRGALLLPVVPTCSSSTCWHQAVKQQQPTLAKQHTKEQGEVSLVIITHKNAHIHACRSVKHTDKTADDRSAAAAGWAGAQSFFHNLTWVSSAAASTSAPCNHHQRPPRILPSLCREAVVMRVMGNAVRQASCRMFGAHAQYTLCSFCPASTRRVYLEAMLKRRSTEVSMREADTHLHAGSSSARTG